MSARPSSPALVRPIPIRPYSIVNQPASRPPAPPQRPPPPRPRSTSSRPTSYQPAPAPARSTYPPTARPTSAIRPPAAKPRVSFDLGDKRLSRASPAPPAPARSSIASSSYPTRPRTASLPTPPPSRQSTSIRLPPLPANLSFLDPSRPPPPITSSMFTEGSEITLCNLTIQRGKPRAAIAHWEHTAAVEAYSALKAHDQLQSAYYCRSQPSGRLSAVQDEVSKDAFYLLRPTIMLLRFLTFSQPILRATVEVASRLVDVKYGDSAGYAQIRERDKQLYEQYKSAASNATLCLRYFGLAQDHFRELATDWKRDNHAPLPPPFNSLLSHISSVLTSLSQLVTAWRLETSSAISRTSLHAAALSKASRSAWYYLQHRAKALKEGERTSGEMRGWLGRGLERFCHQTRSRGGIPTESYIDYFDRMKPYLQPGVVSRPRPELYSP